MEARLPVQLMIQITEESDPAVVQAVRNLINLLTPDQATLRLPARVLEESTFGFKDLWDYLEKSGTERAIANSHAERAMKQLVHLTPKLTLICPRCWLIRGECRCSGQGSVGRNNEWYYYSGGRKSWRVDRESFLALTDEDFLRASPQSRPRLQGFAQHLRVQPQSESNQT